MPLLETNFAQFTYSEIAKVLNVSDCGHDISVNGFSTDTRSITHGNCFIALKGENFNGNLFAKQAVESGASMCILSEEPSEDPGASYLIVEDTVKAYGKLANAYIQRLKNQGARVVAITGSSGKTTVKDMTAHVLSRKYRTYCTIGNHNNHIGVPFTVLHAPPDTEVLALEMGMNHSGEIGNLTKIGTPDLAIITNIGKAHIGNLGSQHNIFCAKLEIVEGMNAKNGRLILPAEDEFLNNIAEIPFSKENLRYSARTPDSAIASLHAEEISEGAESTVFTVKTHADTAKVYLPMTGIHNVTDALLAIHAGLECGMELSECAAALADFTPTALRSDRVEIGNITIIRDFYNANPEAMAASVHALNLAAKGRKRIALLGNMNELGDFAANAHKSLGELCRSSTDTALFCGVNYNDFAEGYGDTAAAFPTQGEMIATLPRLFPSKEPAVVLIKASRGLAMEYVFDALSKILADS